MLESPARQPDRGLRGSPAVGSAGSAARPWTAVGELPGSCRGRRGRLPRLPLSEWRGRSPGQQHCPLPDIIARAAANLGHAVPMPQAPQRPDQLHGIWGLEAATRPARLNPIWPMFPAVRPYFSGAAAEPGKLGAPVKTFIQVTKTEGLTDRGYRAVPPLDPALRAVFGEKPGLSGRRPTPKDQLTTAIR
ncbi:unnamed protein product [Boreogadus saida]